MNATETSLTGMLDDHARGVAGADDRLLRRVYDDFRRLAHYQLLGRPPQTLDSRALVHETYLKVLARGAPRWRDGGHFRASFGRAMRHVLVDAARHRLSQKRGGGCADETLTEGRFPCSAAGPVEHAERLLEVDRALGLLRRFDERLARVVECRFFAGMTEGETAECLGVSPRTVHRDWLRARAWLRLRMEPDGNRAKGVQ